MSRNPISRRNLLLISLGLLILAAMTVVLAPKGARADEGVPIKGNFTVAVTVITNPTACGVGDNCIACVSNALPHAYIEAQGIGDTSRQGTLFLKVQKCADPAASPFGSYQGAFTMTAPNGNDSLTGIYTGRNTSARDAYKFIPFSGELTITGGTGKFDGAQGSASFTAVASSNSGTAFYAVEGTVSLQQGDQ
ncbi:MAG: hypothetical protein ACYDCG_07530 [Candidatus Acidiferrales bacterium]